MGFWSNILGGNINESLKSNASPTEQWLDAAARNARSIFRASEYHSQIAVTEQVAEEALTAAFLNCAFSVAMVQCQSKPDSRALGGVYKSFVDSVRVAAIARYGQAFADYQLMESHFTTECNSVGEMCQRGRGSMMDRLIPAIIVLSSVWAVHALNGNSAVSKKFIPARTPITMFAISLKSNFDEMVEAFMLRAADQC